MNVNFDHASEKTVYLNQLSPVELRQQLLLSESYFDMDLPPYFNFQPLLEFSIGEAEKHSYAELIKWKSEHHSDVNYSLLHNKDGEIGWRPFELINPLIYAKCVELISEPSNWQSIKDRFELFQSGVVECCSMPVVVEDDQNTTKEQILNWWKKVEQRSLELSLEYSHVRLTDVSNCYPSIYSHAIGWAIHGKEFLKIKKNRFDEKLIGNQLDRLVRSSREGQTNGIPQASLLSHLLAELILGYCDTLIDEAMDKNVDVRILRYRDDYRIFGASDTDCQKALKIISEKLNIFGMKLGSVKATGAVNVILGAVKQDKIEALLLNIRQKTLQKELLIIHQFAQENPSSGAIKFLLGQFLGRLSWRVKRGYLANENITVLTSILMDLASTSPHVFPAVATGISELMLSLGDAQKSKLFELVLKRTQRIPNSGYMETWLQRIAVPNKLVFFSSDNICHQMSEDQICLWNYEWVENKELRTALKRYSIVDRAQVDALPSHIERSEFDAFWKGYD